jgi:hypothetical protein
MSCKRYDCLYHPRVGLGYNCDYMLLTGKKRECKPGRKCDKYKFASTEEQLEIRRKQTDIVISVSEEKFYAEFSSQNIQREIDSRIS